MTVAAKDVLTAAARPQCLVCARPLSRSFIDLGMQPLANSYVAAEREHEPEPRFPLHARVCESCLLVQVDPVQAPESIFSDYAYFSSYSESWLRHCRDYVETMSERFGLGRQSRIVEIASNDGYLLQYFVAKGMRVLGVEPAANVAKVAIDRGIPTEVAFFGTETAGRLVIWGWSADLVVAKNVFAIVPDINDFMAGDRQLMKPVRYFKV